MQERGRNREETMMAGVIGKFGLKEKEADVSRSRPLSTAMISDQGLLQIHGHMETIHAAFTEAFASNKDQRLLSTYQRIYELYGEWETGIVTADLDMSKEDVEQSFKHMFTDKLRKSVLAAEFSLDSQVTLSEKERKLLILIFQFYSKFTIQKLLTRQANIAAASKGEESTNPHFKQFEELKREAANLLSPLGVMLEGGPAIGSHQKDDANKELNDVAEERANALLVDEMRQFLLKQQGVVEDVEGRVNGSNDSDGFISAAVKELQARIVKYQRMDESSPKKKEEYDKIKQAMKDLKLDKVKKELQTVKGEIESIQKKRVFTKPVDFLADYLERKNDKEINVEQIDTPTFDSVVRVLVDAEKKLKEAEEAFRKSKEWTSAQKDKREQALQRAKQIEESRELTGELKSDDMQQVSKALTDACKEMADGYTKEYLEAVSEGKELEEASKGKETEEVSKAKETEEASTQPEGYFSPAYWSRVSMATTQTLNQTLKVSVAKVASYIPTQQAAPAVGNADAAINAQSKWMSAMAVIGEELGAYGKDAQQVEETLKDSLTVKSEELERYVESLNTAEEEQKNVISDFRRVIVEKRESMEADKANLPVAVRGKMVANLRENAVLKINEADKSVHQHLIEETAFNVNSLGLIKRKIDAVLALEVKAPKPVKVQKAAPSPQRVVGELKEPKPWKIGKAIGGTVGFLLGGAGGAVGGFILGGTFFGAVTLPLGGLGAIPGATAGAVAGGVAGSTFGAGLGVALGQIVDSLLNRMSKRAYVNAVVENIRQEPSTSSAVEPEEDAKLLSQSAVSVQPVPNSNRRMSGVLKNKPEKGSSSGEELDELNLDAHNHNPSNYDNKEKGKEIDSSSSRRTRRTFRLERDVTPSISVAPGSKPSAVLLFSQQQPKPASSFSSGGFGFETRTEINSAKADAPAPTRKRSLFDVPKEATPQPGSAAPTVLRPGRPGSKGDAGN